MNDWMKIRRCNCKLRDNFPARVSEAPAVWACVCVCLLSAVYFIRANTHSSWQERLHGVHIYMKSKCAAGGDGMLLHVIFPLFWCFIFCCCYVFERYRIPTVVGISISSPAKREFVSYSLLRFIWLTFRFITSIYIA